MRPLRGIALKLASVFVFIVMTAMIKATAEHVPAGQTVFFRSFFAIPVIVVWLAWRHELATGFRARDPMAHFRRGFAGTLAMGLGFASLAFLPLPEVTALGYASPILTVVFAAVFLGEVVRRFRIACVALGIIGVGIVLAPRLTVLQTGVGHAEALGATLVLMSAVAAALAQIQVRQLVQSEQTATIVFWFSVIASLLSLLTLPFGWVVPTMAEAALLVTSGLLGGLGQILLTSSYREADASLVAPFDYAAILFAIGFGWYFFDEKPTANILIGAGLVIIAGVAIILRERHLGLQREKVRKANTP